MGLHLIMSAKHHSVTFSDDKLKHVSYWGEETNFKWEDIKSIHYSNFKGAHILEVKGKKLKLSDFLVGGKEFVELVKSKIENQH